MKDFTLYPEAFKLKQLGFDEPCLKFYTTEKLVLGLDTDNGDTNSKLSQYNPLFISAPTYSQAFRWFREKYQLHSTITSISQESWQWHITKPGESLGKLYDEDFYTYEEAELQCLQHLIKIVKNK